MQMLMAGGDSGDDHDARARFLLSLSPFLFLSFSLSPPRWYRWCSSYQSDTAVSEHTGLAMVKSGDKVHF